MPQPGWSHVWLGSFRLSCFRSTSKLLPSDPSAGAATAGGGHKLTVLTVLVPAWVVTVLNIMSDPVWTIGEDGGDKMVLMEGGGIGLPVVVGVMEGGRGVKEANRLEGNWSWVLIAVPAVGGPVGGSEAARAALDFFWSSSSSGLEGGVIWLPWPLAARRVATMVLTELAGLPGIACRATD